MHLKISQFFIDIAFVLFMLLPSQAMKTGDTLSRRSDTISKIHHEIFNQSKLVNFFLAVDFPSLAHSKNINFMGR